MDEKALEQAKLSWSNAPDEHVFQAREKIDDYDPSIGQIILEEADKRVKVQRQKSVEHISPPKQETLYKDIGHGLTIKQRDLSYLQARGLGMIALGIAHIAIPQLAWFFSIPLIIAGILNIIFPKRAMFLLNGLVLIVVGAWNVFLFIEGGAHVIWKWIGMFQVLGGAEEMGQFFKNISHFDTSQFDGILESMTDNKQRSDYLLNVIKGHRRYDIRREALKRLADIGKDASFADKELHVMLKKWTASPELKCWLHYALAIISDQKENHINQIIAIDQSIQVKDDNNNNDPGIRKIKQAVRQTLDLLKSSDNLESEDKELVKEKIILSHDTPFIQPILNFKSVLSVVFWLFPIVGLPLALMAKSEIKESGGKQYGLLLAKISLVVNSILVALVILGAVIGNLSVMLSK